MPTTASNLYTVLAGGLAFLGLGAFLTRRRKARIAVRR
jgi:LPXTG-motif cell wall-anchored protein